MQKFEFLWKIMFVVVLIVASFLFNKVYIFQTHPHFETVRQGNLSEMLIYGLPFAFVFTLFDLLVHHLFDDLCQKYYITNERYIEPQSRKKRCYTLVKWAYSILYYIISSIWCYKILCETRFMPTWLGGKGSPYILVEQGTKVLDATFEMKVYYIIQFGKHFARFFGHVFIRPEGNFFEYSLHHGLSVFLIVFSYLTNQWLIGLFVLMIHDYSDCGLTIARMYRDYKYYSKSVLNLLYINLTSSWVGCRIILFMAVCIVPSFIMFNQSLLTNFTQFELEVLYFPYAFMLFMMVGLQILHIFWTYYIFQSFISTKVASKAVKHTYD